jgi:hypothetical protein
MGRIIPSDAYTGTWCPICGTEVIDVMGEDVCPMCQMEHSWGCICEKCKPTWTRNEKRIRKAAEARGYQIREMWRERLGAEVEMQGREGGWFVYVEPIIDDGRHFDGFVGGETVNAVLECIGYLKDRSNA